MKNLSKSEMYVLMTDLLDARAALALAQKRYDRLKHQADEAIRTQWPAETTQA